MTQTRGEYGLKLFRPAEAKAADAQYAPAGGGATRPTTASTSTSEPSYALTQAKAYSHVLIYAAIEWISTNVTSAPMLLAPRSGDGNLLDQHQQFLSLLKYPSDFDRPYDELSGQELLDMSIWSIFLKGGAYWSKQRNDMGRVIGLEYLWPDCVEVRGNRERAIAEYRYRPGGRPPEVFGPEDLVHLRLGRHPYDPTKGRTPLDALLRELWSDDEAASWTAALLRNKAIPGGLLSVKPGIDPLNEDQMEKVKAHVQGEFAGANRGKIGFVGIPMDWQMLGFNPAEMDLSNIRAMCEARVAAAFQIPAAVLQFLVGIQMTAVGATLRELERQAWNSRIVPLQNAIAQQLAVQLLPDFEVEPKLYRLYHDLTDVESLQEDENRKADRVRADYQSVMITQNEARQARGFDPLPGGDVFYVPLNLTAVPARRPSGGPSQAGIGGKALGFETKANLTEMQAGVIEALARDFDRLVEVFSDDLVPLFEDLAQRVSAAFLELAPAAVAALSNGHSHKNGLDSLTPMTQAVAIKQTDDDAIIVQRILARFDLASWQDDRIGPLFLQHYRRTFEGTVNSINTVMRLGVNIPDPVARQIIAEGGTRLGLLDIETDTRDAIFRALHAGRENGEGPLQVARRIREHVGAGRFTTLEANRPGAGVRARANLIARTETKAAQNASSLEAYRHSEAVVAVVAVDDQRGHGDDECSARDGTEYSFEEAAQIFDHPNGTLSWSPVVAL